jgi:alkylhydroperoxidase family enzyme
VRRLTGDEHLDMDFATEWPEYDLDERTRALLEWATKLTESPARVTGEDIDRLREAGWDEEAIHRATALISFFNFSGRLESASGLPPDQIPDDAAYWRLIDG